MKYSDLSAASGLMRFAEPVTGKKETAEVFIMPRKPKTDETPKKIAMKADSKKIAMKQEKKAIETKAEPVLTTLVQVGDKEFDITDIALKAYKAYKSVHRRKAVTDFKIYVKPEEGAAYYTVNGEGSEEFKVDLT